MPRIPSEPPIALVIHCFDPRFQKAFDGFIHEKLSLDEGEYIPLLVPHARIGNTGEIAFERIA